MSGSAFAKCAPTPSNVAAAVIQAAGQPAGSPLNVTNAGSSAKLTA
jgi:hypothetical protein